jgi:hypothetical protein
MAPQSGDRNGIILVRGAFGDFFVPEESDLYAEVRETGGQARFGLAMLSSRLNSGDTVVDLGAGVGMLSVPLQRAVGGDGRVWCFEPDAGRFSLLRWNLALNGVGLLARTVAGETWPHLDTWCRTAAIDHIEAIRVHGSQAAAALAQDGLQTLETSRPTLLFTQAFGTEPDVEEAERLERELRRLGYSFYGSAGAVDAGSGAIESTPVAGLGAGPASASVIAVSTAHDPGEDDGG